MKIRENIKGFQELSLMEWRGVVASIIFFGGCNFRCFYCHNHDIAFTPNLMPSYNMDDILKSIEAKKDWIEGVVLSGGEPTIYRDEIIDFISIFKGKGLKVKLYTNGYLSDVLQKLIDKRLIDAISMDIKHIPDKYEEITRISLPLIRERVLESIEIIKKTNIDKEFRITVIKGIHSPKDLAGLKELINPERLIIQNVNDELVKEDEVENVKAFSEEEFKEIQKICEV